MMVVSSMVLADDYKLNLAVGLFTHHVDNTTYVDGLLV